jgi:hypothetical protein
MTSTSVQQTRLTAEPTKTARTQPDHSPAIAVLDTVMLTVHVPMSTNVHRKMVDVTPMPSVPTRQVHSRAHVMMDILVTAKLVPMLMSAPRTLIHVQASQLVQIPGVLMTVYVLTVTAKVPTANPALTKMNALFRLTIAYLQKHAKIMRALSTAIALTATLQRQTAVALTKMNATLVRILAGLRKPAKILPAHLLAHVPAVTQ